VLTRTLLPDLPVMPLPVRRMKTNMQNVLSRPQMPASTGVTMMADLLEMESVALCLPRTLASVEARELRKPGWGGPERAVLRSPGTSNGLSSRWASRGVQAAPDVGGRPAASCSRSVCQKLPCTDKLFGNSCWPIDKLYGGNISFYTTSRSFETGVILRGSPWKSAKLSEAIALM
jgi:hypothetical protein